MLSNTCNDFENGSYCIFIDPRAERTIVDCRNKRTNKKSKNQEEMRVKGFSPTEHLCNCGVASFCSVEGNNDHLYLKSIYNVSSDSSSTMAIASDIKHVYIQGWNVSDGVFQEVDEIREDD